MIQQAAREAGLGTNRGEDTELSVVFLGPRRMQELNRTFLDHDWVTDVIAFNLDGEGLNWPQPTAGEVIVCPKMAVENGVRFGTTPVREIVLYMVHGLLHLAGMDDSTDEGRRRMDSEQGRILAKLEQSFSLSELMDIAS